VTNLKVLLTPGYKSVLTISTLAKKEWTEFTAYVYAAKEPGLATGCTTEIRFPAG